MRFEFATATRILFGNGTVGEVPSAARKMGKRALIVTGRSQDRAAPLVAALRAAGLTCDLFAVEGEPTVGRVREGARAASQAKCDVVIGFGGGSAIDAGKAIAAFMTSPGDVLDYLEVVGAGRPLESTPAPFIAVPTTAGTGSEVTRNAVLASEENRVKASLRSPLMLPRMAVVDPDLTMDLPPAVTASTGLDALTQLIEPYVSARANPMTDVFCLEGMRRVARSLLRAFRNGRDTEARTNMSLASLFGGLALANAGLGVVHGFAAPVGGMFPAPHGAVCAALLPHGMAANIRALREREVEGEALHRYQTVARILTGDLEAVPEDGAAWAERLSAELQVPPLRAYGVREADVDLLVEKASKASSMKANPVALTAEELRDVLVSAL